MIPSVSPCSATTDRSSELIYEVPRKRAKAREKTSTVWARLSTPNLWNGQAMSCPCASYWPDRHRDPSRDRHDTTLWWTWP